MVTGLLVDEDGHVRLGHMARQFIPGAILLAMMIGGLLGLFLGWSQWKRTVGSLPLPTWRIVVARIGLFAVTSQAGIFVILWTPLLSDRSLSPVHSD
jgi:hypothetical protein